MPHFAKIGNNNIVELVLVGRPEDDGKEIELSARTGDCYRQTSYNTRAGIHYDANNIPSKDQSKAYRKNFAGIGYIYDVDRDAFYPQSPYPSWILNEESCLWEAPIPMPLNQKEGFVYIWQEETLSWKEVHI